MFMPIRNRLVGSDRSFQDVTDPWLSESTGKFLPTRRTSGISTSELLSRIVEGYRYGECELLHFDTEQADEMYR